MMIKGTIFLTPPWRYVLSDEKRYAYRQHIWDSTHLDSSPKKSKACHLFTIFQEESRNAVTSRSRYVLISPNTIMLMIYIN